MFKITCPVFNLVTRRINNNSVKRFFLSKAYRCDEVWENRLKNPAFQKVDISVLYHDLDICFQKNKRISALDVDLLCNIIQDSAFKNELDDVLLRIRLCPECGVLPERTTHAAIRWYMDNVDKDELFNVLSDRLNYGLFPNYHLTNLLMDKYLKEKDSRSAVKAAVLQMLQEDLDNSIMKALALYCCYNYLESPDVWLSYKEPPPDPDEEVQKVAVLYIRNPYFDDHFDIQDTNHFVGKTLWMFGSSVGGVIGASSQLIGLVLYEKYEKCVGFLENAIKNKTKFYKEAVTKAKEYSLKKPKQVEENNTEGNEEEKVPNEWKNKVLELLGKIDEENLVKGSLLSESSDLVKQAVKENESKDIEELCKIYKQWEKDRENHIQLELNRAETEKVKSEIKQIKEELEKEEEKLFFFDNEEELTIIAQQKEEEMAKVVYYKDKKKKDDVKEDVYIPPHVQKKHF